MMRKRTGIPRPSSWIIFRGILAFCLLLSSITASSWGRTAPILSAENHVWFATGYGLYRYDKTQDEKYLVNANNLLKYQCINDLNLNDLVTAEETE